MRQLFFISVLLLIFSSCKSQTDIKVNQIVGGGCDGCEAIFEHGDRKLSSTCTLPNFESTEPKLKITGTVYKNDGKSPAKDVILYIYHTNRNGIYETKGDETGWARQHGFIRGWVKTGADGSYAFYTFRPAAYPNGLGPEHIHLTIKEPNKNEYYVDSYVFDDDPMLTKEERNKLPNRGGSGIANPKVISGILTIERDIILGLNIPNYK